MNEVVEFQNSALNLRSPTINDAKSMWQLVGETGVLDQNSAYLYLLLCRDFSDSCLVGEVDGKVVGFVTAYRLPARPDVLFVWQVGVAESMQRRGVALRLLTELVNRSGRSSLSHIEATISPSNVASRRLFQSLARLLDVQFTEVGDSGFLATDFPPGAHESEPCVRVGPLNDSFTFEQI